MKLSNNKILITGGGSGIGLGLTERFVELGNDIIICGRREDVLKEVADKYPTVSYRVCDLSNEEERVNLRDWIAETHPDLNMLINNAGIQQWMNITDDDFYTRAKAELEINVHAPLHLSALFLKLPSLDTIVNVSSGLSFVQLAKTPVYCGTKALIHSFTKIARYTLQDRNVEVVELIPPALNTDLGGKGLHDFAPPVSAFIDSAFTQLEQGSDEVTFGFSDVASKAGPKELEELFDKLNSMSL